MKQRRGWAITVGILLCLLTGGNAFGADLTLTVPVKVSNLLPEVKSVWAYCTFYGTPVDPSSTTTPPISSPWKIIEYRDASRVDIAGEIISSGLFPVDGAVNKTVTVVADIPDNVKTVSKQYFYECHLALSNTETPQRNFPTMASTGESSWTKYRYNVGDTIAGQNFGVWP